MADYGKHIDDLKFRFLDVARPNLFSIQLFPPNQLPLPPQKTVEAAVKTAVFPSMEVGDLSIVRMGLRYPVPGDVTMGEVSVTFFNDAQFLIRDFFMRWIKLFVNDYGNAYLSVPKSVMTGKMVIYQHAGTLETVKGCTLFHAWPKSVGEIQLAHDSESTSEEFTVSFAYTYFKWSKTTAPTAAGSMHLVGDDAEIDSGQSDEAPQVFGEEPFGVA